MIFKILSSLEKPYSSGARVRVWEVQSRWIIGNTRVSFSTWEWSDFTTMKLIMEIRGGLGLR